MKRTPTILLYPCRFGLCSWQRTHFANEPSVHTHDFQIMIITSISHLNLALVFLHTTVRHHTRPKKRVTFHASLRETKCGRNHATVWYQLLPSELILASRITPKKKKEGRKKNNATKQNFIMEYLRTI